jgi:hypothetical protein
VSDGYDDICFVIDQQVEMDFIVLIITYPKMNVLFFSRINIPAQIQGQPSSCSDFGYLV